MSKLFLILVAFCSLCGTISAQNRPSGITVRTIPMGATLPGTRPHTDTERHKIRLTSIESDYGVLILFQHYINGKYVPRDHFDERIASWRFGAKHPLVFEIAPELHRDSSLCKLFFTFPDMHWLKSKPVLEPSKLCVKYLFFEYDTEITDNASIPILLVYEDDRTTGEIENKLKEFVVDGKLKKSAKTNEFIEQNVEDYSLVVIKQQK